MSIDDGKHRDMGYIWKGDYYGWMEKDNPCQLFEVGLG